MKFKWILSISLPALREALKKAHVTATTDTLQNIKMLGKYKAYWYLQITKAYWYLQATKCHRAGFH